MFGCWTEEVGVDEAGKVQDALNRYPGLDMTMEIFSVAQINDQCIEITINSSRGDFPFFEVLGANDIIPTLEEVTPGVPDNNFVSVMIGGRPSQPFNIDSLDASEFQKAMDSLFEAKCPTAFSDGELFESFEGNPEDYHFGDLVNDVEPFCGKKSIKTPRKLYPMNSERNELLSLRRTITDFYVCFAYSGLENAEFVYKYRDTKGVVRQMREEVIPMQSQSEGNIWSYACVHPYKELGSNELIEAKLEGDYEKDFFVDAVLFSSSRSFEGENLKLSEMRLRAASPNQEEFVLIDRAEVELDNDEFEVILYPLKCGHDFGLFELTNKQETSPTGDSGSTTLAGGSGTMYVVRTMPASPPIQGNITVDYMGYTSPEIDVTMEPERRAAVLQGGIPGIGTMLVELSDDSTCANTDLHVTFMSKPGDQDLMTFGSKVLTAPPSAKAEIMLCGWTCAS